MIFLTLNKPYYLLTEEQKVRARAAKKRWRDKNRAKQHALTVAWQRRNRARINKQYRDRYAANPELYRAKLKAKRATMGAKYRAQIKRARMKMRSTPEGMLYHRTSQSVRRSLSDSEDERISATAALMRNESLSLRALSVSDTLPSFSIHRNDSNSMMPKLMISPPMLCDQSSIFGISTIFGTV